jgi:ketol-acid reductoisomerase
LKAREAGFTVLSSPRRRKWADVIVILAPDQHQRGLYAADIQPHLVAGNAILFGHGFSIRFGYITAPEASATVRREVRGRAAFD